jgi:hypothetical protein
MPFDSFSVKNDWVLESVWEREKGKELFFNNEGRFDVYDNAGKTKQILNHT